MTKCSLAVTCTYRTLCLELHLKLLSSARVWGNKGWKIELLWIYTEAGDHHEAGGSTWQPYLPPEVKHLPNPLRRPKLFKSSRKPPSPIDWKLVSDRPGRPAAFAFTFFNQPPATWPQFCTAHVRWEQKDLPAVCMRQSSHLAAISLPISLAHLQLYYGSWQLWTSRCCLREVINQSGFWWRWNGAWS